MRGFLNNQIRGIRGVNVKTEVLAGITVALALIPESVAFAFVAGVSPMLSLQTAVMMGLAAAIFTRPGMINSSTAPISIVMAPLIAMHGLEYLFAAVILMGIIQLLIGVLKLGKYARMVPYPVMLGFLNGLSIVILISQFDLFKENTGNGKEWLQGFDLGIMIFFVLMTMAIIHIVPKLSQAIPASLVAIVLVTVAALLFESFTGHQLQTVRDFAGMDLKGGLPEFYIPKVPLSLETLQIIAPYAVVSGLVGLTEAVLTLRVIDEMTDTKGDTNKEIFAQGVGNLANGLFGGMGGDAMIGQSIINIKSGGRTRLSSFVAPLVLLFFIMFASNVISLIPLAALAGVMFMVVVGTFEWESLKYRGKIPQEDIVVMIAVMVITVLSDLATAVIAGVILSSLSFAWKKGKGAYTVTTINSDGSKVYNVHGSIFFGSVLNFKDLFTPNDDPNEIVIDFKYAKVMDYSGVQTIDALAEKYNTLGKRVTVKNLSNSSQKLFDDAKNITNLNIE